MGGRGMSSKAGGSALSKLEMLTDKGGGAVQTPIPMLSSLKEGHDLQDEWAKVKVADRKKLPVEEVPLSKVATWQSWVMKDGVARILNSKESSGSMPYAIFKNGQYVLMDGNHRVAAAMLQNKKSIKMKVYKK